MSLRRLDPMLFKGFYPPPFVFVLYVIHIGRLIAIVFLSHARIERFGRRLLSSQNDVSFVAA